MLPPTWNKKTRGLWFYGLAGSGKSFASNVIFGRVNQGFIIDGDLVRKHISFDLGYSMSDRETQIRRIFGFGCIAIQNKMFPIMSSVMMNEELVEFCRKEEITVVRIERDFEAVTKVRDIYDGKSDVVGMNISLPELKTPSLMNDGTANFVSKLEHYAKSICA